MGKQKTHRQILRRQHSSLLIDGGSDVMHQMINDRLADELKAGIDAAMLLAFRLDEDVENLPVELVRFYEWVSKELYLDATLLDDLMTDEEFE